MKEINVMVKNKKTKNFFLLLTLSTNDLIKTIINVLWQQQGNVSSFDTNDFIVIDKSAIQHVESYINDALFDNNTVNETENFLTIVKKQLDIDHVVYFTI